MFSKLQLVSLLTLVAILTSFVHSEEVELPSYIHVCHKSDPELEKCFKDAIDNLKNHLATGIEEIDVPGIDPLYIGELNILSQDLAGFVLKTKDVYAYEAGNFQINDLRVTDLGKSFDVQLYFRRVRVEGIYNINGRFLTFPIKGQGKFNANFSHITADVKLEMEIKPDSEEKNRYTITDIKIKANVERGKVKLYDLFGGDRILGNIVNNALNQNFEEVGKDLLPIVEKALAKKLKVIGNKILIQFTYEQLLPD